MSLSFIGEQMAKMSGLRSLMEDIAESTSATGTGQWLNLSIGNPAAIPEVVEMWRQLTRQAVDDGFAEASCRYGPSRGAPELVEAIAGYFRQHYGWDLESENIVVGPGSQMLCFVAAAIYAGPGMAGHRRLILPAVPDYTGYQGLSLTSDTLTGVGLSWRADKGRMFRYVFELEEVARRDDIGMLLLSTPANPTGRCVTPQEQDGLIGIAERLEVPLFLDHAYGEPFPRISRTLVAPPIHPNVVNCFSMSKAGLPGERIGFAIGPEYLITPIVSFLANSVLHASRLAQAVVAAALASGAIDQAVVTAIRPFYAARRALAEKLLFDNLPADVAWRLHPADGGMFAWLWIDEEWFDDFEFYQRLKDSGVFIAPGRGFFTNPRPGQHSTQCVRITLSVDEDVLIEGIRRVGQMVGRVASEAGGH